jgi:hypothetical protein
MAALTASVSGGLSPVPGDRSFEVHPATHTFNIIRETSHQGFGDAIPPKSGPVAGSKATQTHCSHFHCQFP